MKKILILDKCNDCIYYEDNMYHGDCCWNIKVSKVINRYEREPKKIRSKIDDKFNRAIPKWCPLENYIES